MKTKKNPKFDLETKRRTFLLVGMIISLAIVLVAFKGVSEVNEIKIPTMPDPEPVVEIIIPHTNSETKMPPPPPKMKITDIIIITDDPTTLDPEIEFPEIDDPIPDPIKITEETPEEPPLLIAEEMPMFPGGMASLNRWLSKNVNYPQKAQLLNVAGRVYLNFVVDKDGTISNIQITRGVDPLLDEEAKRVVSEMPKWKPGLQNGKPVKVAFNLFITFQLNE